MTTEPDPVEEDEDGDTYEPEPTALCDGEVLIMDPVEFSVMYSAIAIQVREGAVYVLPAKGKWTNVEDLAEKPKGGLSRIK